MATAGAATKVVVTIPFAQLAEGVGAGTLDDGTRVSVGEVRRIGSPGRREIGHGALAERALEPMIPPVEEFPYTIRLVSDVLSDGGQHTADLGHLDVPR